MIKSLHNHSLIIFLRRELETVKKCITSTSVQHAIFRKCFLGWRNDSYEWGEWTVSLSFSVPYKGSGVPPISSWFPHHSSLQM